MSVRTKADLEAENTRLRAENDTLRYVTQRLLDAGRHEREAIRAQSDSSKHLLDAISIFTLPTIPNN